MEFCDKLRLLREEEGITQSALAENLGVSQSAVAQWEAGTRVPTAGAIVAIARYFDTSADFILGIVDEKLRLVPYYKDISEKDQTFMQAYAQLPADKKSAVGEIVYGLDHPYDLASAAHSVLVDFHLSVEQAHQMGGRFPFTIDDLVFLVALKCEVL